MRKALTLALAGVMAISLAGCGNTDAPTSDNGDKKDDAKKSVKLSVTTTYAGEDTNADNYKAACKEWEEKTGNKVADSSATSNEEFKAKVLTDFETGSEPDVLFFFNGVDSNPFVEQGKVVSVDDIRKEYPDYASNMKDELLGASPVDQKNYSVPVNGYWEGMFVNKEVCEKAGVEVPTSETTWEEFLTICQTIKDKGYTPIAASLLEVPHYWFEFTIFNHLDIVKHSVCPTSLDDENGKAWVAGMNDIKTLYDKGFFPENTLTAKDEETCQLFTSDKAAFLIDGSWKVGGIESAVNDIENYTVTFVPGQGARKTTDTIAGLSSGYYITKKCWDDPDKRAAAVDFVEYMTSDEKVSLFAGTSVTALKNGSTVDESKLSALGKDALAFTKGVSGLSTAVEDSYTKAQRAPIFEAMGDIVTGKTTAEEAVKAVIDAKNAE